MKDSPEDSQDAYAYNKRYFQSGMTGWHSMSYPLITARFREFAGDQPVASLLDFGCGDGFYGAFLCPRATRLDGVDISDEVQKGENAPFYNNLTVQDLGKPWNTSHPTYDALFSSEVVEHVEDYGQFLRNAHGALKPGGRFFLTTTTYHCSLFILLTSYPKQVSPRALWEFVRGWAGSEAHRSRFVMRTWTWTKGHFHGFTKKQLARAFERNGFVVERIEYLQIQPAIYTDFFDNPFKSAPLRPLIMPIMRVCGLLARAFNAVCKRLDLYAPNVLVIARKREGT